MNEPLATVLQRGRMTARIAQQLAASGWTAPDVVSPEGFANRVIALEDLEDLVSEKEAVLAAAAGQWASVLAPWHRDAVTVLKLARVHFANTPHAGVWRGLRARGDSRQSIRNAGRAVESAWLASEPAWTPKAGLTLAAFQNHRVASETAEAAWLEASEQLKLARHDLEEKAQGLHELCVRWYAIATATWAAGSTEGNLVRTVPTTYDPNRPPGQLRFTVHLSPGPHQVRLGWAARRGETFNLYAKGPGSQVWDRFLDQVTQTEWAGETVSPGEWMFKGVAMNAHGTGPVSGEICISVPAALAA